MTPAELKTLRESIGLTAQWLAYHAGVKLRTIQYWEAGRSRCIEIKKHLPLFVKCEHNTVMDSRLARIEF